MIRRAACFSALILVFTACATATPPAEAPLGEKKTSAIAARAFDAAVLVGEWSGRWSSGGFGDAMYITVKKVDGSRVEGSMYIRGPAAYHNRSIPFVGTFEGNVFRTETPTQPGSPPVAWTLHLNEDATELEGQGVGTRVATLTLKKAK